MDYNVLRFERHGHVAVVTLNRPERLNALDKRLSEELAHVRATISNDDDIWAWILTGAGRGFCVGKDLREVVDTIDALDPGETPVISDTAPGAYDRKCFKPMICAVNGIATGAGMFLLAGADIVLAAESATFFDGRVSAGHVTAVDPVLLSRRIGYGNAVRIAIMGKHERLSADRALAIGLVSEVVPDENLMARAQEIAQTICLNAPIAVRKSVEAAYRGLDFGLSQALQLATLMFKENWSTRDFEEGNRAFAEKRAPEWKNR